MNIEEYTYGNGKLKINGNYIGKGIEPVEEKGVYIDGNENRFYKVGNMLVIKYKVSNKIKDVIIENFAEGDFGIWIEETPPYYYEDGKIFKSSGGEGKSPDEIDQLGLEENNFLSEEERVLEDFLWIAKGEKILFEEEPEEEEEEETETEEESEGSESEESSEESSQEEESEEEESEALMATVPELLSLGLLSVSDASSGGTEIVVNGAQCMCTSGTAPSNLIVMNNQIVQIDGQFVATIMDGALPNFAPFGGCLNLTNPSGTPPCPLAVTGTWICPDSGFMINSMPALTKSGKLICALGGQISIVQPGQVMHKTRK